jgi:hypothetical protein
MFQPTPVSDVGSLLTTAFGDTPERLLSGAPIGIADLPRAHRLVRTLLGEFVLKHPIA